MVEMDSAIEYLREKSVHHVVENALHTLVKIRPEDPKIWLANHFREQHEGRGNIVSDEEYLEQHEVKHLIDKAILVMVEERPDDVNVFLEQQFEEAANRDRERRAMTNHLRISTSVYKQPSSSSLSPGGSTSPERRTGPEYVTDHVTPPTSPGYLVRGKSFLHDWTSDLQRYFLQVTPGAATECSVYAEPTHLSDIVATKREYDGIAVDKLEEGWLRITEGTGWVQKSADTHQWIPMGTEAGIVAQTEIPGGFKKGQRVTLSSKYCTEGEVVGKGIENEEKVLVKWDLGPGTEVEVEKLEICVTRLRKRAPTMLWDATEALLPPQAEEHIGLPVIVFDLDETLIYARQGPLHQRAGVQELFAMLKGKAEVVIWTAGMRSYAQAILRCIDPHGVVSHCIYRHPKWHPQFAAGQRKNLSHLGRPLNHTLLVENSPDSLVGDTENSVLLPDFEGGSQKGMRLGKIDKPNGI